MLFNSLDFAIFLPLVFSIYWFVFKKDLQLQNLFLLASSYFFYAWWDWKFLLLIMVSTVVDYMAGKRMGAEEEQGKRKFWLWISLITNLGILAFFKYFNFFLDNFRTAFAFFGTEINSSSLDIVLPVGISFYTFQTLSYTIDVYRKKIKPEKDLIPFAAFVAFFPQLVAGPIERASNLLPQFCRKRNFNYHQAVIGLRQILWGLFKKIVIADNCADTVNLIFDNSDAYSGSTLLLGAFLFSIQIYADFSGYSDIAIGTAKLLGFNLMRNFAYPYFSRDVAEFWRRWHISLSTWFRDYVYVPMGGSRVNTILTVRNVFVIFLVSGFWHGANWTFVFWGILNALYFLPLLFKKKNRRHLNIVAEGRWLPSVKEVYQLVSTNLLIILAWVFFRANNLSHAMDYLNGIFSSSLFSVPGVLPVTTIILILFFLVIEWLGREQRFAIAQFGINTYTPVRWGGYVVLIGIILFYSGEENTFIYFQF